ncbi:F-box protein SKIP23-like [Phragmites australis]|uniref:F-box protein SKIP23-like n=1 Tax=Phragmites australis TaxID=29695 RepID=UPI002D769179|nr:F-box protein SKIP23-like [Phragmites australis]
MGYFLEPAKHEMPNFTAYIDPSMTMASGWADLPDNLLDMVARRTVGIKDYVRLRAVCKSWRSFLSPRSSPPWLMLPYDPRGESCTRGFLDVSDGTVHELDLPETRGKRCCGSSQGWLVLERWPDVWLLNPATRERVQLPPLTSRGEAWPCSRFMGKGARERWEDRAYRGLRRPLPQLEVRKAALSSDPSVDGACTVVVLLAAKDEVVFCKLTDASWTTLACAPGAFSAVDVTYQNGRFNLVSHYGRVAVFDLVSPLREVPTHRDTVHALAHTWDGRCLVQRHGGELLMAAWSGSGRELAVVRLGSDGWWTEAGDVGEDVVLLACTESGGQAFGTATCSGGRGTMLDSLKLTNLPWFSTTNARVLRQSAQPWQLGRREDKPLV